MCLAGTCGPKASLCVCCTFTTLHYRGKHVHHALGAAVDAAASLAYAQGQAFGWRAGVLALEYEVNRHATDTEVSHGAQAARRSLPCRRHSLTNPREQSD